MEANSALLASIVVGSNLRINLDLLIASLCATSVENHKCKLYWVPRHRPCMIWYFESEEKIGNEFDMRMCAAGDWVHWGRRVGGCIERC